MVGLKKINNDITRRCAEIYISAYSKSPWNEEHSINEVEDYIIGFLDSDTKCAYAFLAEGDIIGLAMGLIIPSIGSPYFRIEDICIAPEYQRKGYGRQFIELIADRLGLKGCDSILLGTQRGYPSHKFYLKNGFKEIDSVLLYREIKK